jgi:hypothetical protein
VAIALVASPVNKQQTPAVPDIASMYCPVCQHIDASLPAGGLRVPRWHDRPDAGRLLETAFENDTRDVFAGADVAARTGGTGKASMIGGRL